METNNEAVTVIYEEGKAIGCIHRDERTGYNILHSWERMDMEEIATLIGKNKRILNREREVVEGIAGEDLKINDMVEWRDGKLFKVKNNNDDKQ